MDSLTRLIHLGVKEEFSDLHITGGHPIVYRRHGMVGFDQGRILSHGEVDTLVEALLTQREMMMLRTRQSVDLARSIDHVRVRINVFNTMRGLSLALRLLPGHVPELSSLNLHPSLNQFAMLQSGLILICGTTGSGKSTTIAGMIEEINRNRTAHVVTLEDPIEYRFTSRKSFIEQRELGTHIPSYEQGLLDVLREDPDVIVVGELRERETIRLTLNAVESGHLVISTLHATNPEDALYRICNAFPPESQNIVRTQLASTLAVLIVQKLSLMKNLGFRVPVLTILKGVQPVKAVIRENKLSQIDGIIQTSRNVGMFSEEKYVAEFVDRRDFFTPPFENFKPSEEASPEILYTTPLVDPLIPVFQTGHAVFLPGPGSGGPDHVRPERAGGDYRPKTSRKEADRGMPRLDPQPDFAPASDRQTIPEAGYDDMYVIDDAPPMDELIAEITAGNQPEKAAVRKPEKKAGLYVIDDDTPIAQVIREMDKKKD